MCTSTPCLLSNVNAWFPCQTGLMNNNIATRARGGVGYRCLRRTLCIGVYNNFFDAPNSTAFQTDFDPVRVCRRPGKNIPDNTFGQFSAALILFEYDQHGHARFDIGTGLAWIETHILYYKSRSRFKRDLLIYGAFVSVGVSVGNGVGVSVGVRITGMDVSVGKAVGGIAVGERVGEAVGVGSARFRVMRRSA